MSLKVSVIIPHRIGENIESTLAGVYMSDYPIDLIEIFQAEGTHPTVQRNACIKEATGDILYFIDNDSMVNPENIKNAVSIFEADSNIAIVGGPAMHIITNEKEYYIDKCLRSFFAVGPISSRYSVKSGKARFGDDKDVILCNLFVRRDVIIAAGLFDESLYPNEENALIDKIKQLGYKLVHHPEVVVKRPPRTNKRSYIKMLLNYGRGRLEQSFRDFHFKNIIFFIPAFFTLYILLLPIVSILYFLNKPFSKYLFLYFVPIAFYFLLDIVVGFITAIKDNGIRRKIKSIFVYPYMFFITHFFYGFGFFYGLFRVISGHKRIVKFSIRKYKSFR